MFFSVFAVALLAEGVDRNAQQGTGKNRAGVALLAEGVDRNYSDNLAEDVRRGSPSSRRAWIEIAASPAAERY